MCGIAGQLRREGEVSPHVIDQMCAAIAHRGPDARGTYVTGEIGLGIQRLRIIDLETGDQPIFNEDQSVVVVLNGEIYNFRELRTRLRRSGHTFRSNSDTEVIVHLYEEEGPDCVRSLHGMFAFALWDADKRRLMMARDRVGKKPLFYCHSGGTFTFASELQGLLQDPGVPRTIDHRALDCYYKYLYVPSPLSAFREVRKLPPATVMVIQDGIVHHERYWHLNYEPKLEVPDIHELHERIRAAIESSVRRRMIADVPLGAFLSGGVDSSAVVAAMARHSSSPVKTFAIGFAHDRFNELPYARQVADRFATEHHEFIVEPSAIEILPKIVRHYGEPFGDASAIPSFYLAEMARRNVTVALNGDGGDESFAGYNRYVANAMVERMGRLPGPLRRTIARAAERLPTHPNPQSALSRVRRLGSSLALAPPQRYARHMSYFDDSEREALYTPAYRELVGETTASSVIEGPWAAASGSSLIDVMLEADVETYLPGDLLAKMDIATMANSLEARSPLLDPEVMELAAKIPAGLKVQGLEKKVVLRDAVSAWLPRDLLDRPKMGFAVPLADWFRRDLREYSREVLLGDRSVGRGYFQRAYVERLLDRHASGREDNSSRIWALLVAELWHLEYVDPASTSRPNASTASSIKVTET